MYADLIKKHTPFYTSATKIEEFEKYKIKRCDTHEIMPGWFKPSTISEVLGGYFSHSEDKAINGDYTGVMHVRHREVTGIRMIGKEVNEVLEEIAQDSASLIDDFKLVQYSENMGADLGRLINRYGVTNIARASGLTERGLLKITSGRIENPHAKTVYMVKKAIEKLEKVSSK